MYRFKPLKLALTILTFTFLETSLFANFHLYNAKIELLLILLVFTSLFSFGKQVYVCAFFCGLFKDIFSTLPFGLNALVFILIALFIDKVSKNFFKENKLIFCIFVFMAAFISGFILFLLSGGVETVSLWAAFTSIILPASFISALISPLFFSFFEIVLIENENK